MSETRATTRRGVRRPAAPARWALLVLAAAVLATLGGTAAAEQASQPSSPEAGYLDTGRYQSCGVMAPAGAQPASAPLRCWGYGGAGQLGNASPAIVGDDETPSSIDPVDFGPNRSVVAVSAGDFHTCAILDDESVRCWGFGGNGRLGYGNTETIGDDESPALAGPVNLGPGRTAKSISAGSAHTCAVLDNGTVRCWGYNLDGRLGYNNLLAIGDDEAPAAAGPIDFGDGRTAKAVTAGGFHTCAILDDDTVRCWGFGAAGRLGYGNVDDVGRGCVQVNATCEPSPDVPRPDTVGPVDLGPGRTAKAITAGGFHTCAVLDDDSARCWGFAGAGRLGGGNEFSIGDNETPGSVPTIDVGTGRTVAAISAGNEHTCAVLDNGDVLCWGNGEFGRLGYAATSPIGDVQTPGSVGPVALGAGRTATAISAGYEHTCARMDDGSVRCWGYGANGRLGLCRGGTSVGDDETPATVAPLDLGQPGIVGSTCPAVAPPVAAPTAAAPSPSPAPVPANIPPPARPVVDDLPAALAAQKVRAAALRSCLRAARTGRIAARRRARNRPARQRRVALRLAGRRAAAQRTKCLRRHARIPGRVTNLRARAAGRGTVVLSFTAVGTHGSKAPAATTYLIRQSPRSILSARHFARAPALCRGRCSFRLTRVGTRITLRVTDLPRGRRLHYAVAARDNVSGRTGPRSRATSVRVR
ncbi:MAG: RCC1 domain-containing protein [Thermoleophilia bacterium]